MTHAICFLLVIIAYGLGHAGGSRMIRFRVKNLLARRIHDSRDKLSRLYAVTPLDTYQSLLTEVTKL